MDCRRDGLYNICRMSGELESRLMVNINVNSFYALEFTKGAEVLAYNKITLSWYSCVLRYTKDESLSDAA